MRTKKPALLILALLLVAFLAGVGHGAPLLVKSFDPIPAGIQVGEGGSVLGKHGWKAGTGPRDPMRLPLLTYPLDGKAISEAGTLEIQFVRNNVRGESEALFSFVGAGGTGLFSAVIGWDGPYPTLSFNSDETVYRDLPGHLTNGGRGEGPLGLWDIRGPMFTLPSKPQVGQKLLLTFTWGPTPGDSAVYLDGRKIESVPLDPASMQAILDTTVALVLGGEPVRNERGQPWVHSRINSLIQAVRVSDEILRPGEFMLFPVIRSVGHNAARVAGYSGFLVEGQDLTLTLEADPGGRASCDVGSVRDIPLVEVPGSPGRYAGAYKVKAGDFVEKGPVVGHFKNAAGLVAEPLTAQRTASLDGRVHLAVKPSNDLVPADRESKVGITVAATDANGKKLSGRPIKLTLSTTDEYTGLVGAGSFPDEVGGQVDVDWGGVTDSFGEVTAQYRSGFAAKTVVVNAKDMVSGDLGLGAIRSFIEGKVDIQVKEPAVTRLMAMRGTLEVSASRAWLTADGSSRSRITARVLSVDGKPVQGDQVTFTLMGERGQIKVIQARTDSTGRAFADYIAGTVIGQVQIEVRDLTLGLSALQTIELRADAPAEVLLRAEASEVFVGGRGTSIVARVTDANGNPNAYTDVQFALTQGSGSLSAEKSVTDPREGKATIQFTPGAKAGTVTVRATVMSRLPNPAELDAARGAVFLSGVSEDPGALTLREWRVEAGDEVVKGQELCVLEDRSENLLVVKAPRDGTLSVRNIEKGEATRLGDTLAYVLPPAGE